MRGQRKTSRKIGKYVFPVFKVIINFTLVSFIYRLTLFHLRKNVITFITGDYTIYKQLYQHIPNPFKAGRLTSLSVSENQTTDPNST